MLVLALTSVTTADANTKKTILYKVPDIAYRYLPPPQYASIVRKYCGEVGVPVEEICRIIWEESKWYPKAYNVNRNGTQDRGLMQLNSSCLAEWSWRYNGGMRINAFDAETNLRVGIRHYAALKKVVKTTRRAVLAWNAGLRGSQTPPLHSVEFAIRVLSP